jgi:hypothetical protein
MLGWGGTNLEKLLIPDTAIENLLDKHLLIGIFELYNQFLNQ